MPSGPQTVTAGGQLKVHLTDAAHYGITLLLATGSGAHLASLRALAAERNMRLKAAMKSPALLAEHCRSL